MIFNKLKISASLQLFFDCNKNKLFNLILGSTHAGGRETKSLPSTFAPGLPLTANLFVTTTDGKHIGQAHHMFSRFPNLRKKNPIFFFFVLFFYKVDCSPLKYEKWKFRWKKFVDSGFVKTCDELVNSLWRPLGQQPPCIQPP